MNICMGITLLIMIRTKHRPLFLCGPNRSGTSLLRELINNCSFVNLNEIESNFFFLIKNNTSKLSIKKNLLMNEKFMLWVKDEDLVDEIIQKYYPNTFDVYDQLLKKTLVLNKDIIFYGEKNTYLEFRFVKYFKYYRGNLNFIHIVRNPLNTFDSQIYYKGQKRKINFFKWYFKWLSSFILSKYYSKRYKKNFLSIIYNDLVNNKKLIEKRINNFLSINNFELDQNIYEKKINSSFENSKNIFKLDEKIKRIIIKFTLIPIYNFLIR